MAPKKSNANIASKRLSVTPKKQIVKAKPSPVSAQLPIKSKTGRGSSVSAQPPSAMSTSLLQDFVAIDQSVDFACAPRLHHAHGMTTQGLQEQAQQVNGKLDEERSILNTAQSQFEKTKAEFEYAKSRFEEARSCFEKATTGLAEARTNFEKSAGALAPNIKIAKLRHELAEQRELRRSATLGTVQLQTASNFEYEKSNANGLVRHGLHVSFRQLNVNMGSKDWKCLIDLADAQKLKMLQDHKFPYDVEAEIGPSTGPSYVEPLLSSSSFLEKVEHLQAEAFAYLESSICFKHSGSTEPDVLIARRQQFRAYIDLEKENCDGPFKHAKIWLQDRQNSKGNVAALLVRRNEAQCEKPAGDPTRFQFRGLGVLYLRDEGVGGEMVCLQVKRDYGHASRHA